PKTRAGQFLMGKSRVTILTALRHCRQKWPRDVKKRYVPAPPLLDARPLLAIIVPCYNEQEVLPETTRHLLNKMQSLVCKNHVSEKSKIVYFKGGNP
ncbi:MAG: hypothetical protein LBB61_07710, partial [Treponema sp.]|nr:hypothetical protein [Treponema sp.]